MRQDSVSLERFYSSPLGETAGRILAGRVVDLWGHCDGLSVLGLGYPVPLLEPFVDGARRAVAAIPDGYGFLLWPGAGRGVASVIVPEMRLPFPDQMFDRALLLHEIEEVSDPRLLVRELWRVMAPEGRIVVAAANRRGLWARAERTPFGHGRPWTRRQLVRFLGDGAFQVTASTHALHMPPVDSRLVSSAAEGWERAGHWVARGLGGVVLVEAVKRLHVPPSGGAVAPAFEAVRVPVRRPAVQRLPGD